MKQKTHSMVLKFQPKLGHSVWVDHYSGHRSYSSLVIHLRRGVKKGDFLAWRTLLIIEEEIGVVPRAKKVAP